jgi:hypothetical protein
MRAAGGEFLVLPRTGLWWLEHYSEFSAHLEQHYSVLVRDFETCVIYSLNGNGS